MNEVEKTALRKALEDIIDPKLYHVNGGALNSSRIGLSEEGYEELIDLIAKKEREAVEGLKIRQISGFEVDELGRWWKRYPTGKSLVTDELLLDSLNVRQENIGAIEQYLAEQEDSS